MQAVNEASATKHSRVGNSNSSLSRVKTPRFPIAIDRVAARLEAMGIAATQVAERAGLQRTYITDILEGRKKSVNGLDRLHKLAKALETSPGYLTGTMSPRAELPVRQATGGLALAGTVEEGVVRPAPRFAALPSVPVHPDPRYPGSQAVYAVSGRGLASVGAPAGAWLLAVDARDFITAAGSYRAGQLVVLALVAAGGEELCVRRAVIFPDRIELHPVEGVGPVYTLGRHPKGRRLEVRAVVLKAIQELA